MNTCSTSCLWQVCLCCMYRDYNKMVFQKVIYLWLKWRDGDQISSIALNNQKADQIYESLGFKSLDISQWRRVLLEEGNNWPLGLPSLTVLRHRKGKKNPGGYWWTLIWGDRVNNHHVFKAPRKSWWLSSRNQSSNCSIYIHIVFRLSPNCSSWHVTSVSLLQ